MKRKKLNHKEEFFKKLKKKIQQKEIGSPICNISEFWDLSLSKNNKHKNIFMT
jgi:hypothetical protein